MMSPGMFRSYLATALRVVAKDPVNSGVTIAGLALSLAAALLIALQIWDETHVDADVPAVERLFRVETVITLPGRSPNPRVVAPAPVREMLTGLPEVAQAEHLWMQWSTLSRDDDPTLFFNAQVYGASAGWFELFPVTLIEGSAGAVLDDPGAALISATLRDRLFAKAGGSVLGRTFQIDGQRYTVGAVMEDLPHDTHLDMHLITAITSPHVRVREQLATSYVPRVHTYVRLRSRGDRESVARRLNAWAAQNLPPRDLGAEAYAAADLVTFHLRPVRDIHLQTALDYRTVGDAQQMKAPANASGLYTLGAIALVILVLGSINYVNLSSARAMARTREVAMRKVLGASRGQVMTQFLLESALYAAIATVLALALVELALPLVNPFLGKPLSLAAFLDPTLAAAGLALIGVTALLSGLYPAFYLAAIRPRRIWGAISSAGGRRLDLRRVLVLAQFAASITLLVCTAVMQGQAHYARTLDPGFDAQDVVVLYGTRRGPEDTIRIYDRMEDVLERDGSIVSVSGSSSQPDWDYLPQGHARREGRDAERLAFEHLSVDLDYFDTFRITPIAGRGFDEAFARDRLLWDLKAPQDAVITGIINASAARALGFASPEAAVDELVSYEFSPGEARPVRIVGVVPDTHFRSIRSAIGPMLYYADPTEFSAINVRIDATQRERALAHVDTGFREVLPFQAVSRDFVDEQIRLQYLDEGRGALMVGAFAALAIVISGLGLYGVAALSAQRRTREIALRKTLGASESDLVRLLVWQFSRAVLLANLIAWPLSWWLMQGWLSEFAYRVDLTLTPLLGAALAALVVAVLTVAGHCVRVARANPAPALRLE